MTAKDIAKAAGYSRRTVEPLIRELLEREVCSVEAGGCIYSRRLVRDWAQSEADRRNGTRGGNPAITPADLNTKPNKASAPHVCAVDSGPLTHVPLAAQPRPNEGPLAAEQKSNGGRVEVESRSNLTAETSKHKGLLKNWANPSGTDWVKAETETVSESESEKERNGAERSGTVTCDAPATPPPDTHGNVVEFRAGQPDVPDLARPAQASLAMPVVAVRPPGRGPGTPRPRRNRGERILATGTDGMQCDESRALASWNTLAASVGMIQATMNAATRRRIRTILAACGGLPAWDEALAAAEVAPHWNGTGTSDWRPTIVSFCKPDIFSKLLKGAYAPRERRPAERPRSASDQAAIEAMERILGRAVGGVE